MDGDSEIDSGGTGRTQRPDGGRWSAVRTVLAGGFAGGLAAGAGVAWLTLEIHPHLDPDLGQRAWLLLDLVAVYGLLGLALGALGASAYLIAGRWVASRDKRSRLAAILVGIVFLVPILHLVSLPELGLLPAPLLKLLPQGAVAGAGVLTALAAGLTTGFVMAGQRLQRRAPWRRLAALGLGLTIAVPSACTLGHRGSADRGPERDQPVTEVPPADAAETARRPPVVVLMIDGADPDVIERMVEDGELPAFARLMRRGTWGPLASSVPTLSPILWTTVATGKPVADHGIRDFDYFRLPGFGLPIDRFPRRSVLGPELFSILEALPAAGFAHAPYTSDLRRSKALWEIVGERHPVGVYQWLITWPAEQVNGFMVSGGVFAGPGRWRSRDLRRRSLDTLEAHDSFPADLGVEVSPRRPGDRWVAPYLAPGTDVDRRDPRIQLILRGLRDPTVLELPALMRRYRPRLTLASFYTIDAFQHRFVEDWRDGGPFAGAIAERYRFTDRMLGRFLGTLDRRAHVLVISDHGFDFDLGHHWQAPPGVFFAQGPAFARGRRVGGLGLFDVAPLSLYLVGLPLPEDMPGTQTAAFKRVVRPRYLARHPAATVPTYEDGTRRGDAVDSAISEDLKKELKGLGYLH